jgi:hypothetical protein
MSRLTFTLAVLLSTTLGSASSSAEIRLDARPLDPYSSPRPGDGALDVPLRTSVYFELKLEGGTQGDRILLDSVSASIGAAGADAVALLRPGRQFADGARGWLQPTGAKGTDAAIFIEPGFALKPQTKYTVSIAARSSDGVEVAAEHRAWSFTTEAQTQEHAVDFSLDMSQPPVHWQGGFFTGICNTVFCTQDDVFGPMYRMMRKAHERHPRAWRYQRDLWLTATDDRKPEWHRFMEPAVPNFVRERETRRIASIDERADGVLLRLEDFFGHQQYGIAPGRPLSEDYKPGHEILIADGVSNARSKVIAVDDAARTILVAPFAAPKTPWHLEYQSPPPKKEDPDAPGLFVGGGTHLRRFDPPGTPVYYWGRLDKEFDLAHKTYGRRIVIDFVEAPTDLSVTGRDYSRPKDYAVWHEVVRTTAGHLIDRYGRATLDWPWAVFNEPDLVGDYWRDHWDEVQRFYDYTVDAVLKAFEDRGYDSSKVRVGGWELAGIFGTNLRLQEILAHCSPHAEAPGAIELNAAYGDARLDGRRSRRVEELCRAHGGKGSPCDFLSIHIYDRSEMAAAKLLRAKEMALEADADFFRNLWTNAHEACPNWQLPPDEAADHSYLGNGYYPTWCLDVVHRQLRKAADDPRYAFGESVLSIWPPPTGLGGATTFVQRLNVDDDGDGLSDRLVHVPMPIFHAINLLSDLGPDYWPLATQQVGGHVLGGFASRDPQGAVRLALFSHHAGDIQSRSDHSFKIALDLNLGRSREPSGTSETRVTEYRFDRDHNSYYRQALALREGPAVSNKDEVDALARIFEEGDPAKVREAFPRMTKLDVGGRILLAPALMRFAMTLKDAELHKMLETLAQGVFTSSGIAECGFPRQAVEEIKDRARLRPTRVTTARVESDGSLRLTLSIGGNGATFVVIEEAKL